VKPMLARTVGPKYSSYPCYVQPKLNGVRALFQKAAAPGRAAGIFQSRDEKIWNTAVLQHLHDELSGFDVGDLILDGELYRHGWRLQQINGAVAINRLLPREDTHEVCFHVFDVVDPQRKFTDRWLEIYHGLIRAVEKLPHIKIVPTGIAGTWSEVEQYFYFYTQHGYEGVMLRPDGPYEFGEHPVKNGDGHMTTYRSTYLWKHKHWEDDEFLCVGVTDGEGKAEIGVGALVLTRRGHDWPTVQDLVANTPDLKTFKVGTGLTDQDRIAFATDPPIGRLIKVRYLTLTADGVPFNPSFIAVM
jgi:ATP-dependent DNA ligase